MDWHVVIAQILNSSYVLTFINITSRYDTFKTHSYTHIHTQKSRDIYVFLTASDKTQK